MYKLAIALLLIIITSCSSPKNSDWISTIGNSSVTRPTAQAIDNEGNIYLSGIYEGENAEFEGLRFTLNGEMNAFILKLNPNGNLLWSINLGQKGIVSIQDIENDRHGDIYALVSLSRSPLTGNEGEINFKGERIRGKIDTPLIMKISSNGVVKWVKEFPNYNRADLEVLKVSAENIFIGGGLDPSSQLITRLNNYDPDYLSGKIILLNLDLEGNIKKQILLEGNYVGKITDIEIINEKSLYVSGNVNCPEGITPIINRSKCEGHVSLKDQIFPFQDNYRGFIAKVESSSISKVQLIGNSIKQGGTIRSITVDENKNIYTSGNYRGELKLDEIQLKSDKEKQGNYHQNTIYFSKMDSSFNHVWGLTTKGGSGSDYTWDIVYSGNKGLIAVGDFFEQVEFGGFKIGRKEEGIGQRRLFIAQINEENGEFKNVLTDNVEFSSGAMNINASKDGTFFLSGFVDGKSKFRDMKFGFSKGSNAFVAKMFLFEN